MADAASWNAAVTTTPWLAYPANAWISMNCINAIVLSARELLVRQRTQLVNAVRGHAAEFGIVAAKNISHLPALLEAIVAEAEVPDAAKAMLAFLGAQVAQLDVGLGLPRFGGRLKDLFDQACAVVVCSCSCS